MLKCNLTIKFWSVIAVFFLLCFNYLNIEKPSVKMSYCSDVSLFPCFLFPRKIDLSNGNQLIYILHLFHIQPPRKFLSNLFVKSSTVHTL